MHARARAALDRAVALWFLAAVTGQWLFVYYISAFYGPPIVTGDLPAIDRKGNLTDGYVAGDTAGNLFFVTHMLFAAIMTFGGTLQLVPALRRRAVPFHRWNGRVFMVTAIGAAGSGLWLLWVRGTALHSDTGLLPAAGVTLNALLIFACVPLAWLAIRARNIDAHRRWATRLFIVVNGTWFMRIGMWGYLWITNGGIKGVPFFRIWSFASYLLPLALHELLLRARKAPDYRQYALAIALAVLTGFTIIGEVALYATFWRPLLTP